MARILLADGVEGSAAATGIPLHLALRIACAMCFIGHGAWGVITKAGWLPFYGVFGIPSAIAWKTMPLIGTMDILLGVTVLVYPFRAALIYMVAWTVFTALLRPAAGMGWWEFLERGGNYGPPLAFYLLVRDEGLGAFARVAPSRPSAPALRSASWGLRASIALLLIGHGGFALVQEKALLLQHWRSVGIHGGPLFLRGMGRLRDRGGSRRLRVAGPPAADRDRLLEDRNRAPIPDLRPAPRRVGMGRARGRLPGALRAAVRAGARGARSLPRALGGAATSRGSGFRGTVSAKSGQSGAC